MSVHASIVIPTYNKSDMLRETLRSLTRQNYPRDEYEVIIVDDCSTDDTEEMLGEKQFDLQLRVVRHEMNRGRAAARNSGIERASGDIIVFLDDDMVVVPEFLRSHMDYHGGRKSLVVIGNVMLDPRMKTDSLTRYISTRGVHKLKPDEEVPFKYFVTNNSSVRKSNLLEAGAFDERFTSWGGEDLDLGCRLRKMGLDFAYCPEAISYHIHIRTLEEACDLLRAFGERSVPILVEKHPELSWTLKLNLLEPVGVFQDPFSLAAKKILFKFAMQNMCYGAIKRLTLALNNIYVPDLIFDYIWVYNWCSGFKKATHKG